MVCVTKLPLTSGCGPKSPSPVCGNTFGSQYRGLRGLSRGRLRSVDRKCAGRNAYGVKGSSPDRQSVPWWPSQYGEAKAVSTGPRDQWRSAMVGVQRRTLQRRPVGTTGVLDPIEARSANAVVAEIDIEKFFNSIEHGRLLEILEEKIADPFVLRHIRRLLRCSVLHTDGKLARTETGTPQGSPVSPILANICLNAILDQWFQQEYAGKGELVRYADDAVFVFTDRDVARRYISDLEARMNHVGLKLNRDKCNVVPFSCEKPEGTFSFLGFSFYQPLPKPPAAAELVDITRNHGSKWNHKPKSRMR